MAGKWLTYFPGKAVFKVEHILQTLQTFFWQILKLLNQHLSALGTR